jgi:tRNA G10  N-methylase Trm11
VSNFNAKSICILGRQPALGLAELERLYGSQHLEPLGTQAAKLDIEAGDINFTRLGGTIKVAKILANLPTSSWAEIEKYLLKNIPPHLAHMPEGKFTLGISAYDLGVKPETINKTNLKIKSLIKKTGRPVRVVPNKEAALNSAQVLHNSLIKRGGWELLLIANKKDTILAQTMFIQDIEAYGARDQARPKRDARVGMLPPKLAQIIVNLAAGQMKRPDKTPSTWESNIKFSKPAHFLDPFCGTGVILQEALLMGYEVTGTDLEPRMVEYSKANLDWLKERYPHITDYKVEAGDATAHKWAKDIDAVAAETYLGRPLSSLPEPAKLKEIVSDVNTILEKFLKNLAPQLKPGVPVCLAVPAWRSFDGWLTHLPLIDRISTLGYNLVKFKALKPTELIYFREGQTVARQLLVLVKR